MTPLDQARVALQEGLNHLSDIKKAEAIEVFIRELIEPLATDVELLKIAMASPEGKLQFQRAAETQSSLEGDSETPSTNCGEVNENAPHIHCSAPLGHVGKHVARQGHLRLTWAASNTEVRAKVEEETLLECPRCLGTKVCSPWGDSERDDERPCNFCRQTGKVSVSVREEFLAERAQERAQNARLRLTDSPPTPATPSDLVSLQVVLNWLKEHLQESEQASTKSAMIENDYGKALLARGHAEAYAYALQEIPRVISPKRETLPLCGDKWGELTCTRPAGHAASVLHADSAGHYW